MRRLSDILASGEVPGSVREKPVELIEPTADEIRNGWDAETLTAYVQERTAAQCSHIYERQPKRPTQAKGYNPKRWRR